MPFWGLSLIAVTIAYIGPLVYMNNREVIDARVDEAQSMINSHAKQLKGLAEERTTHATGLMRQYVDDYSTKAQGYLNPRSVSPEMTKAPAPVKTEPAAPEITMEFPEAPKDEPVVAAVSEEPQPTKEPAQQEPLLA